MYVHAVEKLYLDVFYNDDKYIHCQILKTQFLVDKMSKLSIRKSKEKGYIVLYKKEESKDDRPNGVIDIVDEKSFKAVKILKYDPYSLIYSFFSTKILVKR